MRLMNLMNTDMNTNWKQRVSTACAIACVSILLITPVPADDPLGGASRPKPQLKLDQRDKQYKRVHQFALRLILLLRFKIAKLTRNTRQHGSVAGADYFFQRFKEWHLCAVNIRIFRNYVTVRWGAERIKQLINLLL